MRGQLNSKSKTLFLPPSLGTMNNKIWVNIKFYWIAVVFTILARNHKPVTLPAMRGHLKCHSPAHVRSFPTIPHVFVFCFFLGWGGGGGGAALGRGGQGDGQWMQMTGALRNIRRLKQQYYRGTRNKVKNKVQTWWHDEVQIWIESIYLNSNTFEKQSENLTSECASIEKSNQPITKTRLFK